MGQKFNFVILESRKTKLLWVSGIDLKRWSTDSSHDTNKSSFHKTKFSQKKSLQSSVWDFYAFILYCLKFVDFFGHMFQLILRKKLLEE